MRRFPWQMGTVVTLSETLAHPSSIKICSGFIILLRAGDPGVHQEECGQQDEGGSPSPLHCPGEASSGVLCPVLGSPVQER